MTDTIQPDLNTLIDNAISRTRRDFPELTPVETPDDDRTHFGDLVGERVHTVNRRGRRLEAVLLGAEPDPTPGLDGSLHRALVYCPNGGYDLAHVLRVPEWRELLFANDWTLQSLSTIVGQHPTWSFTRRGRITSVEKIQERQPFAPLRVMDCVYLVSETANGDLGAGGEFPLPEGELDLNRLLLVLERRNDGGGQDIIIGYCPANGARIPFSVTHTRFHRLFQATRADWCPQRTTVIENVARSMRDEYTQDRYSDGYDEYQDYDEDYEPDPDPF